ncbi:MAG TPA: hypothetical protein VJ799_06525, partial [Nitrososphaeraceae archaeon]|nr:hypothetical protein [Nitrososphaeraceae archaeon]
DIKNIHVLTMATEEDFEVGTEQYSFVQSDLRKAANNPDIKWIVVTMHHPIYSSPNECSLSDCQGNEELSELYHPLFDKYGVDIVLQAHARNYQRSFPLEFNQESPSNPVVTSTSKGEYKNPNGAIFAIVGTGGGELKHELEGAAPFMAFQQDSKFGILDMLFSDNNMEAKFIANDGSTMDQFSLSKTAKKKVIERISEDTFSDTNIRTISDEETTAATPLAGQVAQDGKPSITFKLDEEATTAGDTTAKPLAQDGKPSITFKLDEEATTAGDTTAKPLAQDGKPSITFKLDEEATATASAASTNSKAESLEGQEVQEVKQAVTTNVDDSPPKDDKPMLLSEEQVKQEQVKPAVTTNLDDSPSTDDKSIALNEETIDNDIASTLDDNAGKSNGKELGSTDINNDVSDEDSEVKTVNTNLNDPFASLN